MINSDTVFAISNPTGSLTSILIGRDVGQLGKGNISRRANWARTDCLGKSDAGTSRRVSLVNALRNCGSALSPGLKQDAAVFATIWWGRREAAGHGGQTPFLDISFDEYEPHLAKIDMHAAGAVRANGRK